MTVDHTHIVKARDLERYADTRDSEAVIPELIYLLVKQSISRASVCRIPYGDSVNEPGWDGLVDTVDGFLEFVPDGASYWEIGTGANPRRKATEDFRKRTEGLSEPERAAASFVFVTPRGGGSGGWTEPAQSEWINERKGHGWKHIQILDGIKLADWMREFPAVGKWMAKKVGLSSTLSGISTPREHWESLLSQNTTGDPDIPPRLFIEGRRRASEILEALFSQRSGELFLFVESPLDVFDFVAACIESLDPEQSRDVASRCLFIRNEDSWRSVVESRTSHILVADSRLGLDSEDGSELRSMALQMGHSILIPLCGAWTGDSAKIVRLGSPSEAQIEEVLRSSGYSETRARELAQIGGGRLSALRRNLSGLDALPPYGQWEKARHLAQAGLAGKWDGNNDSDKGALSELFGQEYTDWTQAVRPEVLRSDCPLVQRDEKWRLVARGEAWSAIGNRLTDEDLDRLHQVATKVLGEKDPQFELPKEERFAASVYGKQLNHSGLLRSGLSETLALVGSRPGPLTSCSQGKAETTAIITVRELLSGADWEQWASLDWHLPLLAEAAPDEFLDAVEYALVDLEKSPFHEVFAQEGGGSFGGSNHMSGLLWALETLAWSPDNLSRVAIVLADLASIDPGGTWANRPLNSLIDIFLPWHVQTCAPLESRGAAISAILKEQPNVGWDLIMGLLPRGHGSTSGCHRPVWRDYIPRDWSGQILRTEYWQQVEVYTALAVDTAKTNLDRMAELLGHFSTLPPEVRGQLLSHLGSDEFLEIPENERLLIWEQLTGLIRRHRKFADADWAMSEDDLSSVEEVAVKLAPTLPELRHRFLFGERDLDLLEDRGNYDEERRLLAETRQAALLEILDEGGTPSVISFARTVDSPTLVGNVLGQVAADDQEANVIPSMINSEDKAENAVAAGFVWGRFWQKGIDWVDVALSGEWSADQKCDFLILLPFIEDVWSRVEEHLADEQEKRYWNSANVNPYGPERELTVAIEKLIEHGRPEAAVLCVSCMSRGKGGFDVKLAEKALVAVLEMPDCHSRLDQHWAVEVIKTLQESPDADPDALFRIEWGFLPLLDEYSSGSPVTLENRLNSDPQFFAEIVSLVFRPKGESQPDEEIAESRKALAQTAYKLLTTWKSCPGRQADGTIDASLFSDWYSEVMRLTEATGHQEVAERQLAHVFAYAPKDPDGLWIHSVVAAVLNARDASKMRREFINEIYNQRGVFSFSAGEEEKKLAGLNRERADALDKAGFTRLATAMRELAAVYDREAERESREGPYLD